VDDTGQAVPQGEMGELLVRGPTSAVMYWNNREQSRRTFMGEWTRSGDKYVQDEQGCYTYCGRNDDMLKVSGLYVSPFEVEGALQTHAEVLECAVVAWLDADGLVKPKAFVVLKQSGNACDDLALALKDHVKATLAPFKYPRWIEFRQELPKTATGKIQRFRLRTETSDS
jgi:benzoate-CoA ligase